MSRNYTVYHLHSDFSLQDSCTKYQDYINRAVELGQTALASTEHGLPREWVANKIACDKAGIKFILGVEMYLTEDLDQRVRDNYHTVLLARNEAGRRELLSLIERSSRDDHFYYDNRISFDEFLAISDNIISTSACLASPLWKLPMDHPRYMELARKYDYFEVQAHAVSDQVEFNKRLLQLSRDLGTPLIAGTDTHSLNAYKAECRALYMLSQKKKPYGDEDTFDLTYKTYDELVKMFEAQGALPEDVYLDAIENTNRMADSMEDFTLDTSIKYPISYGTRENDAQKFTAIVEEKFRSKVERGIIPPKQVPAFRSAIDEEIRVFHKLGMDGFMLSMSEILSWCRDNGLAIGPARGSVGGSRVAYVADIIDLNPETWHTVFSRFANENRVEVADIDVDVIESDRPAIFAHIIGRFGADKTARVAAYGTAADKKTIEIVGRGLRVKWNREHGLKDDDRTTLNPYALPVVDEIKALYDSDPDKAVKKYPELFRYYDGINGIVVSQSVHPAGMIISPVVLADHYGVFHKDGEICLLMDMNSAHDVGLVKYDLLVLKTVQVIRDTCAQLGLPYPRTHEIDFNDQAVWGDMLKYPEGCFQFEGAFAFECLKRFRASSIFDMSLVTACIRPSGASYRDDLLARKPHHNPSEMIDQILIDNLGLGISPFAQ